MSSLNKAPKCLSIAGFDGSGGAGIQADLKTFSALGCYGVTVLTALPIQNTCGVRNCYAIPLNSIYEQLEAVFDDVIPDSIKIGMLFSSDIIDLVVDFLKERAKSIPIVLDPVMVAKSGHHLMLPEAIEALKTKMIPLATMITPNLAEAYVLTKTTTDMEELGRDLLRLKSTAVLLKGGHCQGDECNDLFLDQSGQCVWLKASRIDSRNTHGTGCTLSAAIASGLAKGLTLLEACRTAKHYLLGALEAAKEGSVGKGQGSVHHFYRLWP